jgi:acetyl-CoA carboxylase carboxyl transferase subunit beta
LDGGASPGGEELESVNWINNVVRPKIRGLLTTKREVPDNLWVKCPDSGQMVFVKDLEANHFVVPGSDFHMRMGAPARLKMLFDGGEFQRVASPAVPVDPLKFRFTRKIDERSKEVRYVDQLKAAKSETELEDAVLIGDGLLDGRRVIAAAQDFRFMGGSLGQAAGEAVIKGMLTAVEAKTPFILFAASGGARMQEGILSLMQMPRTTIAVQRLRDAKLPYIVVLTDPTTGGVTASYAMLGDVHIAEPGALICFAGPRVIQQTIREQLPDGFQRAEYLLDHGMIDMVVHRHKLRDTLARLCRVLTGNVGRVANRTINGTVQPTVNTSGSNLNGQKAPKPAGDAKVVANGLKPANGPANGSKPSLPAEPVPEHERYEVTHRQPPADDPAGKLRNPNLMPKTLRKDA